MLGCDGRPRATTSLADHFLSAQLREFTERTGIAVELALNEAELPTVRPEAPNRRPDVLLHGGSTPPWAAARAMDIGRFVDPGTLRSDFGEFLLSAGTTASVGGALLADARVTAIPLTIGLKGLVFYPKARFLEAGYAIPNTWEELVALSHQIVGGGRTPWCFAFSSGDFSGWPGTDFVESLVLRMGGVDVYDAWTTGEVGFTSPAVMEAGRLADDLIFEPGFVREGPSNISQSWYDSIVNGMLASDVTLEMEPECWLYHQADFVLRDLLPRQIGSDIDFFTLPPIEPNQPTPTVGHATFASALVDTPEVRAFMEFVAGPEWGEIWATDALAGFISPNRRFDASAYGDADLDPSVEVRTRVASLAQTALESGCSDSMPLI